MVGFEDFREREAVGGEGFGGGVKAGSILGGCDTVLE